jgi:hypothetical protein
MKSYSCLDDRDIAPLAPFLAPRVGARQGNAVQVTAAGQTTQQARRAGWLLVILLPLGLVGLLRGAPAIDDR